MELTVQENANKILNNINPGILPAISDAFKSVHPEIRMQAITLDKPSFIVAIGKNAEVQAKVLIEAYKEKIVGYRIHQIKGYSPNTTENDSINANLDHPIPDEKTFAYTQETLRILKDLAEEVQIHFIISGGGSAAFALPENGISPSKYREIVRLAMIAGFNIEELNLIRSLIDQVKGGKVVKYLKGRQLYSWISSDVVSDDPRLVASGPINPGIVIDNSIVNWINRLFLSLEIDLSGNELVKKLEQIDENNSRTEILSTRMDLISSLQLNLEKIDFQVVLADTSINNSVEIVATQIAQLTNQFSKFSNRILVFAGEPSISLTSQALHEGKGGRVSALSCFIAEEIVDHGNATFIGFASDGKDGSSPLSGYVINSDTIVKITEYGPISEIVKKGNSGLVLDVLEHGMVFEYTDINFLDIFLIIIS